MDKVHNSKIDFSSSNLTNRIFFFFLKPCVDDIPHLFTGGGRCFRMEVIMIFQISADLYSRCLNLLMPEEGKDSIATTKKRIPGSDRISKPLLIQLRCCERFAA